MVSSYRLGDLIVQKSLTEEEEDKILRIVQNCLDLGLGVVASKQALTKSSKNLRPSIRICASSELTDKEISTAREIIEKAISMI
jgi:hypothetical protein